MAFLDFHFFSETLALSCSAHVLLPQKTTRQIGIETGPARSYFSTLYLLHGLSDDHTAWTRRTAIERYASARNLAVIMPAVGRSFYQDAVHGLKYWTFLSEELPAICELFFPLASAREKRFVAGLSMGGYGAFRWALARPERFAAAASLSGALDVARRIARLEKPDSRMSAPEWEAIFGAHPHFSGSEADLWALAEKVSRGPGPRPALYLSCGREDALLTDTRDFQKHLENLGYPATYREIAGDHTWQVWDAEIQNVIAWLPLAD